MGIAERREREKGLRRETILDAAEKLIFSKGIEQTTMEEVAEVAEISKGTIYLYFKNKDDLFHGIVHRAIVLLQGFFERALAIPKAKGIDKLQAIADSYLEFYQRYPNYIMAMLHREVSEVSHVGMSKEEYPFHIACKEAGARVFALIVKLVGEGMADGSVRGDLDPMALAMIMWGHITGAILVISSKKCVLAEFGLSDADQLLEESVARIQDYLNPCHSQGKGE